MDIRVGVAEAAGADRLLRHLAPRFDRRAISLDRIRREVVVSAEPGSRATVDVIEGVGSWLEAEAAGSATLSIGDRSFTMVGAACPAVCGGSG